MVEISFVIGAIGLEESCARVCLVLGWSCLCAYDDSAPKFCLLDCLRLVLGCLRLVLAYVASVRAWIGA